jgi:spectinomycin phosphotransferase
MLEKPDIQDRLLIDAVDGEYGLQVAQVAFLPLGCDVNTAVYRLITGDESQFFLKLRRGDFDEVAVTLPYLLKAQGIPSIIAPLETLEERAWGSLGDYKMILYPFIEGQDGYQVTLSDRQWLDFGAALSKVHTSQLPPSLARLIPSEDYNPHGREMVRWFLEQIKTTAYGDPTAAKLAAFMKARREEITRLVERAEELACILRARYQELVLCHADIHPGNLLIGSNDELYIVDWDNPIWAHKERDLALIGGCDTWYDEHSKALFYQGYGEVQIDWLALAYYRYERIVQDMMEFGKQLFLTTEGGEDREEAYQFFTDSFLPGHAVEIAFETELTWESFSL